MYKRQLLESASAASAAAGGARALPPSLTTVYLASNSMALALTAVSAVLKGVLLALAPSLGRLLAARPAALQPQLYAHWKPGAISAAQWLDRIARVALIGAMFNSVVRCAVWRAAPGKTRTPHPAVTP